MKRRIVSVTPSRVDRDSRTFKEAASLTRLGYESVVVEAAASAASQDGLPFTLRGPGGPEPAGFEQPGAAAARRAGVRGALARLLDVPLTIGGFLASARADAAALPPADLYWLHGYHQFPAVWLAARRHSAPWVYDAHDYYPEVIEGGARTRLEGRLMRGFYLALEWLCARRATEVVTVSEGVATLIERRSGRRPQVLRNCAELRLGGGGGSLRAAVGVPDDAFLVVMPGNHKEGMRAIEEAIHAFAALPPDAHLAFVGARYEPVLALPERLGIGDRVHFHPPVPAAEVPSFIASADAAAILYLPGSDNIANALPNGFFSAVAAGLALLYPDDLVEIRRLGERHDLGLPIRPRDPASIADGIRVLLEDREALGRFRANARAARDELSWEREERTLAEIAERALAAGRR